MRNPNRLKRKLDKHVINRYGADTYFYRSVPPTGGLDLYGEPVNTTYSPSGTYIRIVLDTDKLQSENSEIGGQTDDRHEYIQFYFAGDVDLRLGDDIAWPQNSTHRWLVKSIVPFFFENVVVINEARAFKDDRVV